MQAQRLPAGLLLDQSTMFLEMSIAVQTQRVLFSDPQMQVQDVFWFMPFRVVRITASKFLSNNIGEELLWSSFS